MYPTTHREYLVNEFERRTSRNPNYSLRAFSRDIGLAASTLSEILKGRYGLSRFKSLAVARKLNLTDHEAEHFADLFQARRTKGSQASKDARARIRSRKLDASNMTLDAFHIVSDWYHFGLLELIEVDKTAQDPKYLARRLGVDVLAVEEAIRRMLDLGVMEYKDNRLVPTDDFTGVGDQVPSAAIRRFHRQILEKAIQALEFQSVDEREFSSTMIAITREELPEAKKVLAKFRRNFAKRFSSTPSAKDSVYCLSQQFFNLLNPGDAP